MEPDRLDRVLPSIDAQFDRNLANLFVLLRQPSISAQDIGIEECAALEMKFMEAAGLSVQLLETERHPMVYGERLQAPGKPTVLIYGHYDVQPPEPLEAWETPPFEPTVREGMILGRGSGDNKGQHFANLCGIQAWFETIGELPVNVKVLLEGEEETGSPHLAAVVEQYRDLLACDLVYTADGPVQDDGYPQIDYGVRGVLSIELRAHGARSDLHSGNWGGIAPNAAWKLVHALGTMMDENNDVLVEGFYDDVEPLSDLASRALSEIPLDQQEAMASIGIVELPPPSDVGYFERLAARPTMSINGLTSGYQGEGSKTVIPSRAVAKIDIRLVPNQRADDIYVKIVKHLAVKAPDVEIERKGSMEPSSTALDHPLALVVRKAVEMGFGTRPIDIPLLGGSLPDYVWTQLLGVPSFVVPYAQSDERNHAPNERFEVERFRSGTRTMAALLSELSQAG